MKKDHIKAITVMRIENIVTPIDNHLGHLPTLVFETVIKEPLARAKLVFPWS